MTPMTPDDRIHELPDELLDGPTDARSDAEYASEPTAEPLAEAPAVLAAAPAPRDSEQSQLDLGVISTGAADVDQALRGLENISERPVDEHAGVYEAVLGGLTAAMDDSGPSGS